MCVSTSCLQTIIFVFTNSCVCACKYVCMLASLCIYVCTSACMNVFMNGILRHII
jgi:hypothetical protein